MLTVEVIDDLEAAEAFAPEWDEQAVARSIPMCSPGWMLAWWRNLAPAGAGLRILTVRRDSELVAIAPWFVQTGDAGRVDVRFLGAEVSDRVDILCLPGREREVAPVLRQALLEIRPRADLAAFEAVSIGSPWTRLLASGWPGRARLGRYRNSVIPAPTVTLPAGPPEAWLAGRSRNFRGQIGRMGRRLESLGGGVRQITDPAETQQAVGTLLALHASRWEGRGRSNLARPAVQAFLSEAAATLGPDRLRLWAAEINGEPISIQLFIAAGGEIKYWNGGWDEAHADLKPSMLTISAALQDAIARGQQRLDLGAGTHPYKLRFADGEDPLTWGGLTVHNRRWPRTAAELAPKVLRYRGKLLVQALPAPVSERIATVAKARRGTPS
jgi:CelD/BcsL family acetyltransferase involved in cellulose biosynthesis